MGFLLQLETISLTFANSVEDLTPLLSFTYCALCHHSYISSLHRLILTQASLVSGVLHNLTMFSHDLSQKQKNVVEEF